MNAPRSIRSRFFGLISLLLLGIVPVALAVSSPQRLVVLAPHLHAWVVDLGAGQRIIAAISGTHLQQTPHVLDLGRHGQMSIETIVALKPDLVLAWQGGNRPELLKQLRHVGIPVVALPMRDIWLLPAQIQQVGTMLGVAEKGRTLAAKFQQHLLALQRRYQRYPPVRVFYQMGTRPLTTVAADSWPQQLLEICHAQNVFAGVPLSYFEVSPVQVVQAKPTLIVTDGSVGGGVDWQQWGFAPTHVAALPMQALHQPNSAMLPALVEMCSVLHSQAMAATPAR
ncbi:MAG: ABC transporter substrate-binding protein [Shewanellaceae bacterium]|nr:ABC transporter substrate-binding protein [Shewanellaceae bacterium]